MLLRGCQKIAGVSPRGSVLHRAVGCWCSAHSCGCRSAHVAGLCSCRATMTERGSVLQQADGRCPCPHQPGSPTRDVVFFLAGMSGGSPSLQAMRERGSKPTGFCSLLAAMFQLTYGLLSLSLSCVGLVSAQPSGVKLSWMCQPASHPAC